MPRWRCRCRFCLPCPFTKAKCHGVSIHLETIAPLFHVAMCVIEYCPNRLLRFQTNLLTLLLSCYNLAQLTVFLNRRVLCYVVKRGMLHPPTIVSLTASSVKVSSTPLIGAKDNRMLMYLIKYRKVGDNVWRSTTESSILSTTVAGLDTSSLYEFKVLAKYQGEPSTWESASVQTKTGERSSIWSFLAYSRMYAIASYMLSPLILCVRLSDCLVVRLSWVDQSKTAKVNTRIVRDGIVAHWKYGTFLRCIDHV